MSGQQHRTRMFDHAVFGLFLALTAIAVADVGTILSKTEVEAHIALSMFLGLAHIAGIAFLAALMAMRVPYALSTMVFASTIIAIPVVEMMVGVFSWAPSTNSIPVSEYFGWDHSALTLVRLILSSGLVFAFLAKTKVKLRYSSSESVSNAVAVDNAMVLRAFKVGRSVLALAAGNSDLDSKLDELCSTFADSLSPPPHVRIVFNSTKYTSVPSDSDSEFQATDYALSLPMELLEGADCRLEVFFPRPYNTLIEAYIRFIVYVFCSIIKAQFEAKLSVPLSLKEAALTLDASSRIMSINSLAEALTGWRSDSAIGQHISDVLHFVDRAGKNIEPPSVSDLMTFNRISDLVSIVSENGDEHSSIEASVSPVMISGGHCIGVFLVFRDRSDIAEAEANLQAAVVSLKEHQAVAAERAMGIEVLRAVCRLQDALIGETMDSQVAYAAILGDIVRICGGTVGLIAEAIPCPDPDAPACAVGCIHVRGRSEDSSKIKIKIKIMPLSDLDLGVGVGTGTGGGKDSRLRPMNVRNTVGAAVLENGGPLIVNDVNFDPGIGITNYIGLPLYANSGVTVYGNGHGIGSPAGRAGGDGGQGQGHGQGHGQRQTGSGNGAFGDDVVGFLVIANKEGGFDERDLSTMEPLSAMLTQSIVLFKLRKERDEHELERQRLVAQLTEAKVTAEAGSRAKSQFVQMASHELHTPLNGLIAATELLMQSHSGSQSMTGPSSVAAARHGQDLEYIKTISMCSNALLSLVNNVIDFSRIERGALVLDSEPVDLRSVVEHCIDSVAIEMTEKGLETGYIWDPRVPPCILGDESRMKQVIGNLVGNGLKFTSSGSVIVTVTMHHENGPEPEPAVLISVQDTGIGISREDMQYLFQPFVQVDGSVTRKYGGLGVGLLIARTLAELTHGKVWLGKSEVGRGSVFHFSVPAVVPKECPYVQSAHLQDVARTAAAAAEADAMAEYARTHGRARLQPPQCQEPRMAMSVSASAVASAPESVPSARPSLPLTHHAMAAAVAEVDAEDQIEADANADADADAELGSQCPVREVLVLSQSEQVRTFIRTELGAIGIRVTCVGNTVDAMKHWTVRLKEGRERAASAAASGSVWACIDTLIADSNMAGLGVFRKKMAGTKINFKVKVILVTPFGESGGKLKHGQLRLPLRLKDLYQVLGLLEGGWVSFTDTAYTATSPTVSTPNSPGSLSLAMASGSAALMGSGFGFASGSGSYLVGGMSDSMPNSSSATAAATTPPSRRRVDAPANGNTSLSASLVGGGSAVFKSPSMPDM